MKIIASGFIFSWIFILIAGFASADQGGEKPEKLFGIDQLLPADDEIQGWKHSEKTLQASNEEDLYKIFNGGASLYIQHGFRSYVGQIYKGPKGTEIEVNVFNQENNQNAINLFLNPFTKPSQIKDITDLGEKARIDMTPLFCYGVDFVQKGFFVRVIIQDKTDEGLNVAISFARLISTKIK
jgi:hypothetical protein